MYPRTGVYGLVMSLAELVISTLPRLFLIAKQTIIVIVFSR